MTTKRLGLVAAAVLAVTAYGSAVLATPGAGFTPTTLASAQFDELDSDVHDKSTGWKEKLRTKGPSDLYVQSNVWTPGGTTGWHTHPGPSLIIVTAGEVTVYDGDDRNCEPHVYGKGMGFVDPGGGHTHVIRNEGPVEARTIAVQLIPAGAGRRVDAPAPAGCSS